MQLQATTAAPVRIVPEIPSALSRLSLFLHSCVFSSVCVCVCVCSAFSTLPSLFIVEDFLISYLRYSLKLCLLSPLLSSPLLSASPVSSRSNRSLFLTRIKERKEKKKRRRKEKRGIFSRVVSSIGRVNKDET